MASVMDITALRGVPAGVERRRDVSDDRRNVCRSAALRIHNHAVAEDGPWNSWRSCWFNTLYARVVPSHAVELTSAHLDRSVAITLERHRMASATLQHKQELAAVIHLCGAGAGDDYARRGFRLIDGQRCGDHDARAYLARIKEMKGVFDRLARIQSDRRPDNPAASPNYP